MGAGGTPGEARPRILGIDAARGGAVLLVVLMHGGVPVQDGLPAPLALINHVLGGVRMPLLLFLSGHLARPLLGDPRRALHRAADLFWIYLLWTVIGWASNGWGLARLLLLPESGLWYIWALGFAAVTLPWARRVPPAVPLTLTGAMAMASYAGLIAADPGTTEHLLQHLVFFYIGLHAGAPVVAALRSRPLPWIAVAGMSAAAAHALNAVTEAASGVPVAAIPERLAIVVLALGLCLLLPVRAARPFAWFGRRSLQIYVGHLMVLGSLHHACAGLSPGWHAVTVAALATVLTLLACRLARAMGLGWLYRRPTFDLTSLRLPSPVRA